MSLLNRDSDFLIFEVVIKKLNFISEKFAREPEIM